jgi:hypothetical protein
MPQAADACSFDAYSLLASYTTQANLKAVGDFDPVQQSSICNAIARARLRRPRNEL